MPYIQAYPQAVAGFPGATAENVTAGLPYWATFGIAGLDMRAAWTCLIGIILAVCLEQVHRVLHRHRVLAGQGLGQVVRNGPRHEHHPRAWPSAMKAPWPPC